MAEAAGEVGRSPAPSCWAGAGGGVVVGGGVVGAGAVVVVTSWAADVGGALGGTGVDVDGSLGGWRLGGGRCGRRLAGWRGRSRRGRGRGGQTAPGVGGAVEGQVEAEAGELVRPEPHLDDDRRSDHHLEGLGGPSIGLVLDPDEDGLTVPGRDDQIVTGVDRGLVLGDHRDPTGVTDQFGRDVGLGHGPNRADRGRDEVVELDQDVGRGRRCHEQGGRGGGGRQSA